MIVVINPGSGPVEGEPTLDQAHSNMKALLLLMPGTPKCRLDPKAREEDGRWRFLVTCPPNEDQPKKWECPVDMPGCSLDVLQGSLLKAPRLYVDESSWWWEFAVDALRERLEASESESVDKP